MAKKGKMSKERVKRIAEIVRKEPGFGEVTNKQVRGVIYRHAPDGWDKVLEDSEDQTIANWVIIGFPYRWLK